MNWDIVEGKWDQMKGSVKQQWGKLTDDELTEINGSRDKMSGKLQEKYGWTKEEADEKLNEFARNQS
ncbi:CsbD family protein [Paracoccus jeotgali]|uniref:CsbD family protein n=1 Tax=Paracoccus jeotgali TaxID=2065379 RepID=A0A2K9MFQ9_9RHOB|nr:CsbD family protein [Paracoccus jeotgali]AUM74440.1 CsbD family protein [Paracoccus jeotgali]